jgi:hypothetical protein
VGAVGVGVTDALEDGGLAVVEEGADSSEMGMEGEGVVEREDAGRVQGQGGSGFVIGIVGVGDEGVEAVVASGHLEDDEDGAVFAGGGLDGAGGGAGVKMEEGGIEEGGEGPGGSGSHEAAVEELSTGFHVSWYSGRASMR